MTPPGTTRTLQAMITSLASVIRDLRFDAVDVAGLREGGIRFARNGGSDDAVTWTHALGEAERQRLFELVASLPEGESARCHMPGFGLRITSGGRVHRASICFRCSNAYVDGRLTAFASGSEAGEALRAFLGSLAPDGAQPIE